MLHPSLAAERAGGSRAKGYDRRKPRHGEDARPEDEAEDGKGRRIRESIRKRSALGAGHQGCGTMTAGGD